MVMEDDQERKFYKELILRLIDKQEEQFNQIIGVFRDTAQAVLMPVVTVWAEKQATTNREKVMEQMRLHHEMEALRRRRDAEKENISAAAATTKT